MRAGWRVGATVQRYVTGALSGAGARPAERVPDGEFSGNTRRPADGVSAGGKLLRVGPTDNVQTRIEKIQVVRRATYAAYTTSLQLYDNNDMSVIRHMTCQVSYKPNACRVASSAVIPEERLAAVVSAGGKLLQVKRG